MRERATHIEMEERAEFLIAYAERHGPVTVRQLYYQAEVRGLPGIDKTEGSYAKIQRQVLKLRREQRLPYRHIADATRWMRKPTTYDTIEEALEASARYYRKSLWFDSKDRVEVWCEKDALAGVLYPVTSEYDVPLMVTRGFSSETFAYNAVAAWADSPELNWFVYYLGDFDRSGQDAAEALYEKLKRFAEEFGMGHPNFVDVAVTPDQVREMKLSTRPPKRETAADKNWLYDFACELDAIDPDTLRSMLRMSIEKHLPADKLERTKLIERQERETALTYLADRLTDVGVEIPRAGKFRRAPVERL
jgi:hypothetical protein